MCSCLHRRQRVFGRGHWGSALLAILLGWVALAMAAEPATPGTGDRNRVRLMVKFKADVEPARRKALHERLGGKFLKTIYGAPLIEVVAFSSPREAEALIKAYTQSGLVEYAELDAVVQAEEKTSRADATVFEAMPATASASSHSSSSPPRREDNDEIRNPLTSLESHSSSLIPTQSIP